MSPCRVHVPSERTNEIRTAPWNQGAGSVKSQGDVRTSLGGLRDPRGTARDRGTGESTSQEDSSTGSWEGLPDDGRHLGSSRTALFHENAGQAASAPSLLPTGASRANTSSPRPHERRLGAFGGDEGATGVSEARSPGAPRVEQALGRDSRVRFPAHDECVPGQTRRSEVGAS
jgi:hypothetical protein